MSPSPPLRAGAEPSSSGSVESAKTLGSEHSGGENGPDVHLFSRRSDHSTAITYNSNPSYFKNHSPLGRRRLNSADMEQPRHHAKHDHKGHKKRHRGSVAKTQSANMAPPVASGLATSAANVVRRDVYMTKGYGNRRISINPVTEYALDGNHAHSLEARGLLDPVIPIVGLIPGLEGVVKLVPELLDGLLGPALGDLIISPSKPRSQALAATNDTLTSESDYILAATKGNGSTVWLVDTGRPAPPDTESVMASNSTSQVTTNEHMVSLQIAFVDSKTGQIEPYCATYKRDPTKPVSLGVVPCKDSNPSDSQMFGFDPETSILRAIWGSDSVDERALGLRMRRQYMVGGGQNATVEGGESMVVMVFQAANVSAPIEDPSLIPSPAQGQEDSIAQSGEGSPSGSSKDSISSKEFDQGEADDGLEDYNPERDGYQQSASVDAADLGGRTQTIAPVYVEHLGASGPASEGAAPSK
ncbi:RNA recognition motif protein [Ceratobasidium sp. AG-Ba]|nr:RNA recognition motif protein [Ceratobasidium sp. AG-Ba]